MTADGPVRVFVDRLDVSGLGFGRAVPAGTGRPPYDPCDLLKLLGRRGACGGRSA